MSRTTLKDIAEAAGVSVDMVSRVLTGKTKGHWSSTAEKIERIQNLAHDMNYRPNRVAQMMRSSRTHQIGVLVSELYNPWTGQVLEEVGQNLSRKGYGLLLGLLQGEKTEIIHRLDEFAQNAMDGILNLHPQLRSKEIYEKADRKFPVVTYNRSSEDSPAAVNRNLGTRLILDYLWKLGHRRIVIVTGPEDHSNVARLDGYETFFEEINEPVRQDLILNTGWRYSDGVESVSEILKTGCTACLAGNNLLAAGVCTGLHQRGKRIPEDISVVSMGENTLLSMVNHPQLTTLSAPMEELVEITVDALLRRIEKQSMPEFRLLNPKLIIRESTSPPTKS